MKKDISKKLWIAVYTKPRHEKSVKKQLEMKGFDVYLPLLKERRKWADRRSWVEFPLFKSYIFVRIELKNSIFIIQNPGVLKIVRFGDKIAVIQNNIINALRLMIDGGYRPKTTDHFLKGDRFGL